jgi:hypothetical protein
VRSWPLSWSRSSSMEEMIFMMDRVRRSRRYAGE